MFRPRAKAVIPMDHRYLAEHDGSELAAGRGSGVEQLNSSSRPQFNKNQIPYMSMVYAPIERRLDTAIFRALFASSARQARQFVVHGKVKVNGKKMSYPGYLLNPGDMFQVDVERVLFATGAPKTADQIKSAKNAPSGKRKTALRKLKREIRAILSQLNRKSVADLNSMLNSYTTKLAKSEDLETIASETPAVINAEDTPDYQEKLKLAIQRARENPIDESKPYMTPWQPRPYMSAFAFIPRYLEVNQKICSAVYLRHPVARPGMSEVPSPFSMELLQLAHNWYLRRR
ncbi:37S ribosomal protein NAM9, mitochondrial [Botrytis cinerea]